MSQELQIRTFIKNNGNFRKLLFLWTKNEYDCYNLPTVLKNNIIIELFKLDNYKAITNAKGLNNTILELFRNLVNEYRTDESNSKNLLMYNKTLTSIKKQFNKNTIPYNHPNRMDDYPICNTYTGKNIQYCLPNCIWCSDHKEILKDFKIWKSKKYVDKSVQTENN